MFSITRNYFRLLAEDRELGWASKILLPILGLAGWVYGGVSGFVRMLYEKKILRAKRLPFPVVSVGNLTWGGSGKTPLVEYLARKASEQGKKPLILTRGYSHDETEQFRNHLPRVDIAVGKNRYKTGMKATRKNRVDLGILDDGLQHWPVERDVEIVTVNALNPFGNGKMVPRGILREPLSELKRAVVIVISHSNLVSASALNDLKQKLAKLAPKSVLAESFLEPLFFYRAKKRNRVSIDRLKNQKVTTFSAVAVPRSFQLILSNAHIKPIRNFEFTDHHLFSAEELDEVRRVSESASVDEIITTEKDFYRAPDSITKVLNPLILATRVRIRTGERVLTDHLFRLLGVRK